MAARLLGICALAAPMVWRTPSLSTWRGHTNPHAHYLCWRTGTMDRWECAAFADWLRKSLV